MFKTLSLAGAVLAMTATAVISATPAIAQRHYDGYRYEHGRYDDRRADRRYYRDRRETHRRYRARRCHDGDGGTLVGAIAGGLLGHSLADRGDRTLGTVLGAGGGALAGRAIDRSDRPSYCR